MRTMQNQKKHKLKTPMFISAFQNNNSLYSVSIQQPLSSTLFSQEEETKILFCHSSALHHAGLRNSGRWVAKTLHEESATDLCEDGMLFFRNGRLASIWQPFKQTHIYAIDWWSIETRAPSFKMDGDKKKKKKSNNTSKPHHHLINSNYKDTSFSNEQ